MWLPVLYVFGFLAACCQLSLCANNTLDNVALLSLIPKNAEHLQALNHLAEHDDQVDVLRRSRDYNDPFDLLVPPHKIDFFKDFSDMHGVDFVVRDLQYGRKLQESQRSDLSRSGRRFSGYHPFAYSSYEDMDDFLERLQASNSDLVKLQPLGNSYEGRRLKLVRISTDHSAGNPVIFVDAGIHAREWVAPAMAMYLIYRLTQEKQSRRELDGVDWYILPLVNPDGYEYTRQSPSNRLWRKTRSKNGYCYGVDGNRNYGFRWGVSGVSTNPCNKETYAGPQPFSEPETQIVRNVMMQNADRIKIYVSLHAYGQYLVYPWGYTGESLPKEWKRLDTLARSVSAAVVQAGGKPFKVLSAGKWYAAAGGSDDFAFGAVGIPYSYTMELTDGYEFQYPQKYLRTVLPQYYEGFRVIGNQIKAEFGKQKIKQDQAKSFTNAASVCGCKEMRPCYEKMLQELWNNSTEAACIEDAIIGVPTVEVYMQAIQKYCYTYVTVNPSALHTFQRNNLYQVTLSAYLNQKEDNDYPEQQIHQDSASSKAMDFKRSDTKPVILIDAGQSADQDSVRFALWFIQNLLACKESDELLEGALWVIMPSVNPDGLEYGRMVSRGWSKNTVRYPEIKSIFGVDITRNFDTKGLCDTVSTHSKNYPGPKLKSEKETMFVSEVIQIYAQRAKLYLSLRNNGHALLHPHGYTDTEAYANTKYSKENLAKNVTNIVTAKVNQKTSGFTLFSSGSIFEGSEAPVCGSSVDFAWEQDIPLTYEMRMFHGGESQLLDLFHTKPRGYEESLRSGYYTAIKELFNAVKNLKLSNKANDDNE